MMDLIINCTLLESDEFGVECEVRGIEGPLQYQIEKLTEHLKDEKEDESLIPKRAHGAALRAPRREVTLCNKKLKQTRDLLQEMLTKGPDDVAYDVFLSQLIHVGDRLKRISASKSVQAAALKSYSSSVMLVELIQKMKTTQTPLSESVASMKNIELAEGGQSASESESGSRSDENEHGVPKSNFNDSWSEFTTKFPPAQFKSAYAKAISTIRESGGAFSS